MKRAFTNKLRLNRANILRLEQVNAILEEYKADGYTLTLRQLYYQLVARDIIPNKQLEYIRLSNILKKGRMAGIVDWDAIEDRIRKPKIPYWVHDPKDAISDMLKQYRLDRMKGQENRIEVWVEKDALPPQVLIDLCTTEIEKRIDLDLWEDQVAREEVDILEIKNRFNI